MIDQSTPQPLGNRAENTREQVLRDYRIALESREASLLGRKEVLTGKAKFGIFGDGKELAQLALARVFEPGDFRSGYYRDQTLMMALERHTLEQFFAQLYADADREREPVSSGRQMNAHFATRTLDSEGSWLPLTDRYNSSADLSPTGSQMPRLLGLAYASKLYRELDALADRTNFSRGGNEIAFGTIGNASCAEGMFWETVNAAGVVGAPMLISIWDDGYGISVPNEMQVTKGDLSALLSGFRREPGTLNGFDLYEAKGWDYLGLVDTYQRAAATVRREHVPAIVHVQEVTQPQGHSTSGSHERYKSAERLAWEVEFDCNLRLRQWILERGLATVVELDEMQDAAKQKVKDAKNAAWQAFRNEPEQASRQVQEMIGALRGVSPNSTEIEAVEKRLARTPNAGARDLMRSAHEALVLTAGDASSERSAVLEWWQAERQRGETLYGTNLLSQSPKAALAIEPVAPRYGESPPRKNGFEILNACFDAALTRYPEIVAFGEDVGQLGDVNQGFAGLQEKFGTLRVGDTGIRETTIIGQAIGLALRGIRPIAEIQYLDYVLYALQIISDDLATLRWRTDGGQMAPVIIRTRGHRLEGVWHSGSPMAGLLGLTRGVHLCVPRNMTRAAGFYNTLLESDDPAIVIEVLNGYRSKEELPENIAEYREPLGVVETLRIGSDVTLVTYGACCKIVLEAADQLRSVGIEAEVIDVQTLLPFDRSGAITESIRRTNRVVFVDEDVPGGATAYMLQEVVEKQGAFHWLDSEPRTISAKAHRPAYGSDGDYYSKPNREDIFDVVYRMMHNAEPTRFPAIFG